MTEDKIIAEVTCLKLTVAPGLRLKKGLKNTETNRFQMIKIPLHSEEQLGILLAKVFQQKNFVISCSL